MNDRHNLHESYVKRHLEQSQTLLRCIGDKHVVAAEKTNNVIIGNVDDELTTSASNAVLIGHNADVKVDGGVTTSLFYKNSCHT